MPKCNYCNEREGVIKAAFPLSEEGTSAQLCLECFQALSTDNHLCQYCGSRGNLTTHAPIESLFGIQIPENKPECLCDDCYLLAIKLQNDYSEQPKENRIKSADIIAEVKAKLKNRI